MKKLLVCVFLTFLLLNVAAFAEVHDSEAVDFSVDITASKYYVVAQNDYVTLKINNYGPEDWFSLGVFGSEDWVKIDVSSSLIKIPSASTGTVNLLVSPPIDAVPRMVPYVYLYKISRVGTDSVAEGKFQINIKQITSAIIKDYKLSCTECLDNVGVSGTVYNVGSDPIKLSLISRFANQVKTVDVGYVNIYGHEDFATSFDINGMTPGSYDIVTDLMDDTGKLLYTQRVAFKIPAIENVIFDKDVSSTIFGSFVKVTAENMGNTVANVDLSSVESKSWYSLYSGPTPTGMSIADNYFWSMQLAPGEMRGVSYSIIYWPTYVIILLLVAIAVVIYTQMGAFSLDKVIMGDNSFRPGKEVSVSINLKNKSGEIDRAVVKDVVPQGYDIVSKFDTVKPIIRKVPEGVELNWKVSKLRPEEERVFHYTIRPTEEVKSTLPAAKVRAVSNNKLVQKDSNKVSFSDTPKKNVLKVNVSSK